jgi:6-phospho-beta-glucosidase
MNHGMTICIVGAGSSYTPELIAGILDYAYEQLPVADIRMHDVTSERLEVMAGLARRMIAQAGRAITLRHGSDLAALLDGVDFVITQIRVGGMPARVLDEKIPLKYGIIGQETTGPGGMFKALRTIPHMLEIARTVERVAPQAFILNYTNPSGIITEAVCRHTNARLIGLCSGIPGMQQHIRELLQDSFGPVRSYCVGLNHLGFIYKFMVGERDITREALETLLRKDANGEGGVVNPDFIRALDAVPIAYLRYFLQRRLAVEEAQARAQTRGEEIMEIEREVFAQASDAHTAVKPTALARRGGGGYSEVTFAFMRAIHFDQGDELACTVLNRGTVEGIDADAGVEVVCTVGKDGARPLPVGPIPIAYRGLVQAVKAYESLTVDAAVQQSRKLAVQALINHPLVGDLPTAEALVDELLAAHGLSYR